MKKIVGFLIIIVILLTGCTNNFETDYITVTKTYTSDSAELVESVDFEYELISNDRDRFKAALTKDSLIRVCNFSSTSECKLVILDIDDNVINEILLEDSCLYDNIVEVSGEYIMVLKFESGKGAGSLNIEYGVKRSKND